MRVITIFISLGLVLLIDTLMAQSADSINGKNISSLKEFVQRGHWTFNTRTFAMGTENRDYLTNYFAIASGAGIGYTSPRWKGFTTGFSGHFMFRVFDHNLEKIDPYTDAGSRYEMTLFDMENPENSSDLDRLEELYISYVNSGFNITYGRQIISTPFLNEQDNRMRPNLFSGLRAMWGKNQFLFESMWINGVSPRGTVRWYSMEESMGVYPFGRNIDGSASRYKGNVSSKGLFISGVKWENSDWTTRVYHYYAENVFHLLYSDLEYRMGNSTDHITTGIQGFRQYQSGNGGHEDADKKYMQNGESTFGIGGRAVLKRSQHKWSINTLYIHDSGRYLFPREWGREQFWAGLPRERFEGNGGLWTVSGQWIYDWKNRHMNTFLGAAIVKTNNPEPALLNKYGTPSYYHIAGRISYHFTGRLDGLSMESLIVYKGNLDSENISDQLTINRLDLWNYSYIFNFKF